MTHLRHLLWLTLVQTGGEARVNAQLPTHTALRPPLTCGNLTEWRANAACSQEEAHTNVQPCALKRGCRCHPGGSTVSSFLWLLAQARWRGSINSRDRICRPAGPHSHTPVAARDAVQIPHSDPEQIPARTSLPEGIMVSVAALWLHFFRWKIRLEPRLG